VRRSLYLFILAVLASSSAKSSDVNFVVTTTSGQLRGSPRTSGGGEFLGIPYAQPPVGDLRWRDPVPAAKWDGIRDAGTFGAPCAQPDLGEWNRRNAESSKEDCLFLNVMTPQWPPKEHLPVMFWIHGGANTGGTASSPLYKDGTLVQHGVVLVSVNYRLGVFGFFAHAGLTAESPHHSSGNYGLMDQILALRWVRDNIAQFGGDPGNITVFGQSAGAQDTGLLMISPLAAKMFQRAIAESGAAFSPPLNSLTEAEANGAKLAAALQAPAGADAIKFLRSRSPGELLRATTAPGPEAMPGFGPIMDGWVLPRGPVGVLVNGEEAAIPLIIGTTTREFPVPVSPDELRSRIENFYGSLAPQALPLYGLDNGKPGLDDPLYGPASNQWAADLMFRCPSTTQAVWHKAAHNPTYEYQLEHAIPGQEAQGALHSSDLPYVFGFYPKQGNISGSFGETDFKLADLIESYWTNFAKTGDPNGDKLPNWPPLGDSQTYLRFTQDGSAVAQSGGPRRAQCDLFREEVKQRMSGH
jgi:para-nitrobenzyl esterase